MQWIETTIIVRSEADTAELAQELICNVFYESGLTGVVIEGPIITDNDQQESRITGYVYKDPAAPRTHRDLADAAARMADTIGYTYRITTREVDDEDWATAWKEHFYPQKISDGIIVKPTWRACEPDEKDIVIELDPGMAFGTGTHPTTGMCVRMIERHVTAGQAFLDVGTGSGLLMIAAKKMGAARVWGTDNDPVAIQVARDNLFLNHISEKNFILRQVDLTAGITNRFDCITANILTEVIVSLVPQIPGLLKPDGRFICSGIIDSKKHQVEASLRQNGFTIEETMIEEEWVCLMARLSTRPLKNQVRM